MPTNTLAARHFTTSAIHIIEQLRPRAADRSMEVSEQTMTMLALWSLLRWERKVGLVALEQIGIEPAELANDVNQALLAATDEIACGLNFATALEPLLVAAEHEAHALGHNYVGSEHILLGIIQRACPRLREILQKHEANYHAVKEAIVELLRA